MVEFSCNSVRPELSIVATIYNNAAILTKFVAELQLQAEELGVSYEIILVDDSSTDGSAILLGQLCQNNPYVKALLLAKNHGQQIAMSAGINESRGEFVIIMDGDWQNPPEAVKALYQRVKKVAVDVVYCVSYNRNGILDIVSSYLMWFVIRRFFKVRMLPNQLMMRIMSRRVVDIFRHYGERVRTVGGIVYDIGMPYDFIKVKNRKRPHGKSNYSFIRRLSVFIDFIFELTNAPLNLLIYLGFLILMFTVMVSGYYIYQYFHNTILPGFTTIVLSIFLFGSLNLMIFGIIGRYLANIYSEVRGRPLIIVFKRLNFMEEDNES